MVSQRDEEQQPLLSDHAVGDLPEEDGNAAYNTFGSETTRIKSNQRDHTPDSTQSEEPELKWKTIAMIMSSWIGVFLASIDMSVMSTLTGPISESLSSFQLLTWFINAYTLTSVLMQPLSGKLSDIFGRRNCLLWANLAFLLGNLICGISTKPWHFIFGRAVGGLGGGCLHSISAFLASDVIPLRSRGFWQGVSNVAFAAGFALGGTLGGVINDAFGWQWAFLFQPAPILVSMVLVWWLVPKYTLMSGKSVSVHQIDFMGSITLIVAILALMFGAVSGGNTLPWSSPLVYVPLILFPFLLAAFVFIEIKVAVDPVIPVKSLANRTAIGSCVNSLLCSTANSAFVYYLPMILEVKGLKPSEAGLRQSAGAVGAFLGSLGGGAVMNITGKYYWLTLGGQALLVGSSLAIVLSLKYVTGWYTTVIFFCNGFGFGTILVTMLLALISSGRHGEHAVLTSASYAFRLSGNTLGPTVAGAIFQNLFGQQLQQRLGGSELAKHIIPALRRREFPLDDLPDGWLPKVAKSYDVAFYWVFVFIFATYIVATMTASIIRQHPLPKTLNRK